MGSERKLKITSASNYVELQAPVGLAASYPIILPAVLPVGTEVLTIDSAGQIALGGALGIGYATQVDLDATQAEVDALEIVAAATQAEIDALEIVVGALDVTPTSQEVYGFGEDITLTAGKTITWTQPLDEAGFKILKTGLGVGTVFEVENDGMGTAVVITQDGDGIAAKITKTGGSNHILEVVGVSTISGTGIKIVMPAAGTGVGLDVTQAADIRAAQFRKNGNGAGSAVFIENDGTGHAIELQQDGGDVDGYAKDINGTGSKWFVSKDGVAHFNRFGCTAANVTISGGAITLNKAGFYTVDTEAAAATDDLTAISLTSSDVPEVGTIVFLRPNTTGRTVVVKDGAGNLRLAGDFTMDNEGDIIGLIYVGSSVWLEFTRSSN